MENIPCRWADTWSENLAPHGSGESWMQTFTDCAHPAFPKEDDQVKFEDYGECNGGCPGYEPMEVAVCEKHGEFLMASGCDGCMYDSYKECEEAGREYYNRQALKKDLTLQ